MTIPPSPEPASADPADGDAVHTLNWTAANVDAIVAGGANLIPPVTEADLAPVIDGLDLWDLWPLQLADGATVRFDGWAIWFVLAAPRLPDPEARHGVARIRLLTERAGIWRDHGDALPDGLNPGSREWAGSARFAPDAAETAQGTVTLYHTAAGYPGERDTSFVQRMFTLTATLRWQDDAPAFSAWGTPREMAGGTIPYYVDVAQASHMPGLIKGFRDPAHFHDADDDVTYVLFTASLLGSTSPWNGCIGLLRETAAGWDVLPPVLAADGLNNEQERPHVVRHEGRWYLFWSTQRRVFSPAGPRGPNGLYGMVADRIHGPWRLLNGTGLIAANPDDTPFQTYSWWVTAGLTVHGFVDYPLTAEDGVVDDPDWRRQRFGGVPAPVFRLELADDRARVAAPAGAAA